MYFFQRFKDILIQPIVTNCPVVALDVGVLPWFSGGWIDENVLGITSYQFLSVQYDF
jgi:hypothetical protein